MILLLIRFFYATLLLLGVFLLFPENNPGGSYLILAEGLLIGGTAHWIHRITAVLPVRERSLLSGLSVAVGILPAVLFFPQVNLSITGILALYLGMIGLELILPVQKRIVNENKV